MGRNAVAKYVCSLLVPFFATRNEKELTDPKSASIMTMHVYLHQDSATTLLSRTANRSMLLVSLLTKQCCKRFANSAWLG